ncbi:MAG: Holliday junction branch migration protein RuvA [Candidatus Dormibacteraceae bacterium]
MIAYLRGAVRRLGADHLVVEAGGVGYLVSVPADVRALAPALGETVELHVHTHVREDQLALYGFSSSEELDLFEMLIEVDGVGPRVALNILGAASLDLLRRAILAEDVGPVRRAPGVGPRTAQKVIIDLKPKLEADAALQAIPRASAAGGDGEVPHQVEQALRGLGFNAPEARRGMDAVDWKAAPTAESALAVALKALGR